MTVILRFLVVWMLPLGALLAAPSRGEGLELVANGDMESLGMGGKPIGWSSGSWNAGKGEFSLDSNVAHSGKRSLKIEKDEKPGMCVWRSRTAAIHVADETEVRLSARIKAEDSPWIMVRVIVFDGAGKYHQYITAVQIVGPGFFDWTEHTATIKFQPGGRKLNVYLIQAGTGEVWFDDVHLVAQKDIRPKRPRPAQPTTKAPTPKPSKAKSDTGDLFDTRDYIENTRMAGPAGADGLPHGWAAHNPAAVETIGKAVWCKDEPRPGYYSIRLDWGGRGRYLAVQPSLIGRVKGSRPFRLKGYPRTADGGKAYFLVQCVDRAGRIVSEERSTVTEDAKDYVTLKLDFVTHPRTHDLRVFCVNGGTGKVWFHWISLHLDADAARRLSDFPYTVSCEPAEGNRFWNGGRAVLHSFVDSPTSVSFAFWGDKSRLDDPRLVIDVPKGLRIPEAFNLEIRKPVSHAKAAFTTDVVDRDGAPYIRYTFPGPAALKRMTPRPNHYNCLTLCFVPDRYAAGAESEIYYHVVNRGTASPERQVALRVLPAMAKSPNPKRFKSHLWLVDDINFHDMALVEKAVRKYEEAALAGRRRWNSGREEVIRVNEFLKGRGWFMFTKMSDWGFHKSRVAAVGGDGKKAKGRRWTFCPTYVATNDAFYDEVYAPALSTHLQNSGAQESEYVFLDFEPGSVARRYCFCERCRKRFAKRFSIPAGKIQTREDILRNYSKEWGKYWAWACDEMIRHHVAAVKAVNPTLRNALYCYALPFDKPEATETHIFGSPLDTRLLQRHMDILMLSFYHITGKHSLYMMDVNAKTLEKPTYTMPLTAGTGPFIVAWGHFTRDQILSPAGMRAHILAAAASGCKGVIPYMGKMMDGMYFVKIDQAMSEIAALEDHYLDGKRVDKTVSYEGTTANAGKSERPLTRSDWEEYVGIRAHELKRDRLVTLFNFHKREDAVIKLKISGLGEGRWRLEDPMGKRALGAYEGRPVWTTEELAEGFACRVRAEDVAFALLRPQ